MNLFDRSCPSCSGAGIVPGSVFDPCLPCSGSGILERKCGQCWRWQPVGAYLGALKSGKRRTLRNCRTCREKYRDWDKLSPVEKELLSDSRRGLNKPDEGELRLFFSLKSENRKTGDIPVSMTSSNTCPPSCGYYGAGCYAEKHVLGMHWRRLSRGQGMLWSRFCELVSGLPSQQLWRHNEAGDLPGRGEEVSEHHLVMLARAAQGKRGFTYTHKLGKNLPALARHEHFKRLRYLNQTLTVNLSVDSFDELDAYVGEGLPMTTVLPLGSARVQHTKQGLTVITCPAQLAEDVTCKSCGLCQKKDRKSVVGFRAHGQDKANITDRLTPRRQLPLFEEQA